MLRLDLENLRLDALDAVISRRMKTIAGASLVSVLLVKVLSKCIRAYFVRKYTIINDLQSFGKEREEGKKIKGTAIICGGSIAGLWAAHVCLDHFEDVVIIEPEAWTGTEKGMTPVYNEDGEFLGERQERTRVMQYKAGHAYQVPFLQALRNAFPGCDAVLKKFGGRIEIAEHNLHRAGHPVPLPLYDYPDGKFPECVFLTRESLELALRKLVRNHSDRLRWVTGTVTGFKTDKANPTRVAGVILRKDGAETDAEIDADLVVDCTGGTCAGFKWLKRWSSNVDTNFTPESSSLDHLRISYHAHPHSVTYRYTVPPELRAKLPLPGGYDNACWFYTYSANPQLDWRGGFGSRIEGHRIEFVLGSWGDTNLTTDPRQLRGFLEGINTEKPFPDWLLDTVEMLSEVEEISVYECAVPACYWIQYENAPKLPSNFVALGDAVMRVNPVFGQGCTKALMGAVALDVMLRRTPLLGPDFSKKFFALHRDKVGGLWDGTKPADYGYSATEPAKGETLEDGKSARDFVQLAFKLTEKDKYINSAIWHVRMMLAPATDLMHPYILFRVAVESVKRRWGLS